MMALARALFLASGISCMVTYSSSFSLPRNYDRPIQTRASNLKAQVHGSDEDAGNKKQPSSSRRDFFSSILATAALLSGSSNAFAEGEPTRIELQVDTEYLIRVLNYFDGDMRKVLGVLVRSPLTKVQIDPPSGGKGKYVGGSAKDAILRALYSYEAPEDYITQASWLQVDAPSGNNFVTFLTKKRYNLPFPKVFSGGDDKEDSENLMMPTTSISLSNLEAGVGLAVLSYPLAFGYYNYEAYQEEQEKIAKKAAMAAKKKAAAKKGSAKQEAEPQMEKSDESPSVGLEETQQPSAESSGSPAKSEGKKSKTSGGMDAYEAQMAELTKRGDQ